MAWGPQFKGAEFLSVTVGKFEAITAIKSHGHFEVSVKCLIIWKNIDNLYKGIMFPVDSIKSLIIIKIA